MSWEKKLNLLSYIASDLELIHSNNIVHCDLHSGNIFQNDLYNAYIGDLGISISMNKTLDQPDGIYGALPYVAPEVLQGKSYTQASDVYSFGMIMWEISSGNPVFFEYNDDKELALGIYAGLRPTIVKGTASCYETLLKKCWDTDPEKRPTAKEIHKIILSWKNDDKILSEFLRSDKEIVIKSKISKIDFDFNTIYTSKFINYANQKSTKNEINFDNNISIKNIVSKPVEELDFD
ncbi:kinase-like domain-containing protein [Gigaspora rosea]|uniref:Kinase-like domain-containing protein n=1 Tax=Gigaspora rosea TaxID=44941 RepID=A0A397V7Y0_9GLOM|nr:kinase-like domain-containing protein [Gigaspora rosea]